MSSSRTPKQLLSSIRKKVDRAIAGVDADLRKLAAQRNKIVRAATVRSDRKKAEDIRSSLRGKK